MNININLVNWCPPVPSPLKFREALAPLFPSPTDMLSQWLYKFCSPLLSCLDTNTAEMDFFAANTSTVTRMMCTLFGHLCRLEVITGQMDRPTPSGPPLLERIDNIEQQLDAITELLSSHIHK